MSSIFRNSSGTELGLSFLLTISEGAGPFFFIRQTFGSALNVLTGGFVAAKKQRAYVLFAFFPILLSSAFSVVNPFRNLSISNPTKTYTRSLSVRFDLTPVIAHLGRGILRLLFDAKKIRESYGRVIRTIKTV